MQKTLDPTLEKAVCFLGKAGFYPAINGGTQAFLALAREDPFIDDSGRCQFVDAENIFEQGLNCLINAIRRDCDRINLRLPQNMDAVDGQLVIIDDSSRSPLMHVLSLDPFSSKSPERWKRAFGVSVAAINWYWQQHGYSDRLCTQFNTGNDAFCAIMTPEMISAYLASGFAPRWPLLLVTLQNEGTLDEKPLM